MECSLKGLICGVDEAGRGSLAGPVVSACVVWKGPPKIIEGVKDSKLLSERERVKIYGLIAKEAYRIGIGISTPEEIDRLNILRATILAMERAIHKTGVKPDLVLIDGNVKLAGFPQSKCLIDGDRRCFFVASASIVAKVVRDSIMRYYSSIYPGYGFEKNMGYGTLEHRRAIKEHGASPLHRKTFKGVREFI